MAKAQNSTNQSYTPSFDLERLRAHLDTDEPIQLIIRGHLYLEHVLIEFISAALKDSSVLQFDRISFPIKVQIAVALGTLHKDFIEPLNFVNKARNECAHNLDFGIDDDFKKRFLNSFPHHFRRMILGDLENREKIRDLSDVKLSDFFYVFAIGIDVWRHDYVKEKEKLAEAVQRLEGVLEKVQKSWGRNPPDQGRDRSGLA